MGQPSSIKTLPEDILEKLQELLRDPRVTQLAATAQINAILEAEGLQPVSKSAVNRYSLQMEKVGEKIQQSREIARMWIGKLGAAPQGEMGNLLNESIRSMVFEFYLKLQDVEMTEESMPMFSKFMKDVALTLQRLESSATLNVKREQEIRENERKRLAEETMKVVEKAAPEASAQQLKAAIMEVYGV